MLFLMTLQAILFLELQLLMILYSLFFSFPASSASAPESCSCVPEPDCPWEPYGTHPLDVAVLGLHPPCPIYGHVRCCDKSVVKWYYQDDRTEQAAKAVHDVESRDISQVDDHKVNVEGINNN